MLGWTAPSCSYHLVQLLKTGSATNQVFTLNKQVLCVAGLRLSIHHVSNVFVKKMCLFDVRNGYFKI